MSLIVSMLVYVLLLVCMFVYALACIFLHIYTLSVGGKEWDKRRECEKRRVGKSGGNWLLQSDFLFLSNFMGGKGLFWFFIFTLSDDCWLHESELVRTINLLYIFAHSEILYRFHSSVGAPTMVAFCQTNPCFVNNNLGQYEGMTFGQYGYFQIKFLSIMEFNSHWVPVVECFGILVHTN